MDYSSRITQSADELRQFETQQKLARRQDRIRFLRLLKEGTAPIGRPNCWSGLTPEPTDLENLPPDGYRRTHPGPLPTRFWQTQCLPVGATSSLAAARPSPDAGTHPDLLAPTVGHQLHHQWRQ